MSCHDIGRGMSAVSKTVLDLYEENQISKESAMRLVLVCRKGVHWCDGNEGEALEEVIGRGYCGLCSEKSTELTSVYDNDLRIRFFEIKEKYGSLRLAATGGNKVTDAIIDRCEKDSQRICVQCGKPATRISQGWIYPFCDDCIGDWASVAIE